MIRFLRSIFQAVLSFPASEGPRTPDIQPLRIASPDDILRLGVVATAGFRYSEQFMFERTFHVDYPQDTIVFFRHEAEEFVKSPAHIILVAIDKYDPEESAKTEAVIPVDNGWQPPSPGDDVIVGFGVWKLQPGSAHAGEFQNVTGSFPNLCVYEGRDLDARRAKAVASAAGKAEHKHLRGLSTMERIAVHPAYWRRGHGSTIAGWGMKLADVDRVDQGVLATSMGASLFSHLGFDRIDEIDIPGDHGDRDGFKIAVLKYTANH